MKQHCSFIGGGLFATIAGAGVVCDAPAPAPSPRGVYAEPDAMPTPIVGVEQMRRDAHAAAADPNNPNRERDARVASYFDGLVRMKARDLSAKPGDAERLAAAAEKRARKAARRAAAKRGAS